MTIQEMQDRKAELGFTNKQIAELSGVPLGTVQKVFGGRTTHPRRQTIQKLEAFFRMQMAGLPGRRPVPCADIRPQEPLMVAEASASYEARRYSDKKYTLEDYYALPDDERYELIDGVLYYMAAPSPVHQAILTELIFRLASFVKGSHGPCKVFPAPCDVWLDMDDHTMVQPDILVTCDRNKIHTKRFHGAPDLVIEILSPSTRKKDIYLKGQKYEAAGVREYWMIDPDRETVIVYDYAGGQLPAIYGFDDRIPVGIWDGQLVIDFSEIRDEIAYLYENGGGDPNDIDA